MGRRSRPCCDACQGRCRGACLGPTICKRCHTAACNYRPEMQYASPGQILVKLLNSLVSRLHLILVEVRIKISSVDPRAFNDIISILGENLGDYSVLEEHQSKPGMLTIKRELHNPFLQPWPLFSRSLPGVRSEARDTWLQSTAHGLTRIAFENAEFVSDADRQLFFHELSNSKDRNVPADRWPPLECGLLSEADGWIAESVVSWIKKTNLTQMSCGRSILTPQYISSALPDSLQWIQYFHNAIDLLCWRAARYFCVNYWFRSLPSMSSTLQLSQILPANCLLISSNGRYAAGLAGHWQYSSGGALGSVSSSASHMATIGRWMLLEHLVTSKREELLWLQSGSPVTGVSYTQLLSPALLAAFSHDGSMVWAW